MNENTPNQGQPNPSKGNEPERVGQPNPDRDTAHDQGVSNRPDDREQSIPELDEPDVEGVGNEGRTTDATMPPGEGQNPKRNTL